MSEPLVIEDVSTGEPDVTRFGSKRKPDAVSAVSATGASTALVWRFFDKRQHEGGTCLAHCLVVGCAGKKGYKFGFSTGVLIAHIRTKNKKVGRSAANGDQNREALKDRWPKTLRINQG